MFKSGDIVQHFKREMLSDENREKEPNMYLYEILGEAEHTESGELLMIYRPLYGEGRLYARPLEMFMSPVESLKYPGLQQKQRFEKVPNV